jgi:hypothetical protein
MGLQVFFFKPFFFFIYTPFCKGACSGQSFEYFDLMVEKGAKDFNRVQKKNFFFFFQKQKYLFFYFRQCYQQPI